MPKLGARTSPIPGLSTSSSTRPMAGTLARGRPFDGQEPRLGHFVASGVGPVSPKVESLFCTKWESPAGTLDLAIAQ